MTSTESLARWALSEYRYCGGTDQAVIQQLEKEAKEAAMNETQQETWNATHAQLLKSVADAQARLLAGINEVSDRVVDLKVLLGQTQETVRNSHGSLTGRLDAIGAILAELLTVRRPGPRLAKRAKRRR